MNDNDETIIRMRFSLSQVLQHWGYKNATQSQLRRIEELMGASFYEHLLGLLPHILEEAGFDREPSRFA